MIEAGEPDFSRRMTIREVPHSVAARFAARHYLGKMGPTTFSFGLFLAPEDWQPVGICCYGTPSSAPLRSGICGPEHAMNVIELVRLWVDDSAPRFSESFLISHTIRKVDKEIVVSFADPTAGHIGIVYQATNWIYTGFSAKRTDWTVDGVKLHGQTLADKYTSETIRKTFGSRFSLTPRPVKHRYIFFNCGRVRRRFLLKLLRYPVLPYPKHSAAERIDAR